MPEKRAHVMKNNNGKENFRCRKMTTGMTEAAKKIVSRVNTFRNLMKKVSIAERAGSFLRYNSKITAATRATNGPAGRKYLACMFGSSQYKGKLAATTIKENIKSSLLNNFLASFRSSL
jgi:hypothetical protein